MTPIEEDPDYMCCPDCGGAGFYPTADGDQRCHCADGAVLRYIVLRERAVALALACMAHETCMAEAQSLLDAINGKRPGDEPAA